MAEVWTAHHVHLDHRVAVKFLHPEYNAQHELQERFLNEGKRQAKLQHPNIVPAVDFFQVDGRSFLVMQYVEGMNLEARLSEQNLPLVFAEIHAISTQVLSALDYARSLGIVHRDVKPSNILIDQSRRALLMDFGIAKALTEERSVTLTNSFMGTPDYMSFEQVTRPKEVDARSDIFMHPEKALDGWVLISKRDLDAFLARLKDGTWNAKEFVFNFPKDMPLERQKAIRAQAEEDRRGKNGVENVFVREQILSGVSIMQTV
jgi:serine/threonine protein kinase